jgi:hypothetical protein
MVESQQKIVDNMLVQIPFIMDSSGPCFLMNCKVAQKVDETQSLECVKAAFDQPITELYLVLFNITDHLIYKLVGNILPSTS